MTVQDNKMKKTAFCGLVLALALIAGYVENLVPVAVAIPGIKLGTANSVILILLYMVGVKEAFLVNISRVLLSGFLFGSMSSILFSLSGAVLSLFVMTLIKKTDRFSINGVSMAGGVFHNIGQILVAICIVQTVSVGIYAPVLLITGLITGYFIGMLARILLVHLPK